MCFLGQVRVPQRELYRAPMMIGQRITPKPSRGLRRACPRVSVVLSLNHSFPCASRPVQSHTARIRRLSPRKSRPLASDHCKDLYTASVTQVTSWWKHCSLLASLTTLADSMSNPLRLHQHRCPESVPRNVTIYFFSETIRTRE